MPSPLMLIYGKEKGSGLKDRIRLYALETVLSTIRKNMGGGLVFLYNLNYNPSITIMFLFN